MSTRKGNRSQAGDSRSGKAGKRGRSGTAQAGKHRHDTSASEPAAKPKSPGLSIYLIPLVAAVASAAVGGLILINLEKSGQPSAPGPVVGAAPPQSIPGQPPDLSSMTPRQAADRLFNRIMMAEENGIDEEAQRFVPMALAAYGQLDSLDLDARYHLGRIHFVAGDYDAVREEARILREFVPGHLLAAVLEHLVAEATGDAASAEQAVADFQAHYDTESQQPRREYLDHQVTLRRFRHTANGNAPDSFDPNRPDPQVVAARSQERAEARSAAGERLFTRHCALCHGEGAAGSPLGPPLVHELYDPDLHDNGAFYLAIRQGAKAEDWSFGDMPAVEGVSDEEAGQIIAYVRALQVAQGIE